MLRYSILMWSLVAVPAAFSVPLACALKWPRVDFLQGKILIREGRVLGRTGIPKSAGSLRDIDLLDPARRALLVQKAISWLVGDLGFLDDK